MSDTLISVLFYINVLVPGQHYTVNEINNFAVIYAQPISAIEINIPQLQAVLAEEEPMAIWVLDNLGA